MREVQEIHFHADQAHDPCRQSVAYMRKLLQGLDYNHQGFVQLCEESLQILDTRIQRLCDRDFYTPETGSEFVAWAAARGHSDDCKVDADYDLQKEIHHLLELIVFGMTVADLAQEMDCTDYFAIQISSDDPPYQIPKSEEAKALTAFLTLSSTSLFVELKRVRRDSRDNSLYALSMATATAANRWLKVFHQLAVETA